MGTSDIAPLQIRGDKLFDHNVGIGPEQVAHLAEHSSQRFIFGNGPCHRRQISLAGNGARLLIERCNRHFDPLLNPAGHAHRIEAGAAHAHPFAVERPCDQRGGRTTIAGALANAPDETAHYHRPNIGALIAEANNAAHNGRCIIQHLNSIACGRATGHSPTRWAERGGKQIGDHVDTNHDILMGRRLFNNSWSIHKIILSAVKCLCRVYIIKGRAVDK